MRKVLFSPEAVEDLENIWLYIARDSPDRADNFLDKLHSLAMGILPHSRKLALDESTLPGKYQLCLIKTT